MQIIKYTLKRSPCTSIQDEIDKIYSRKTILSQRLHWKGFISPYFCNLYRQERTLRVYKIQSLILSLQLSTIHYTLFELGSLGHYEVFWAQKSSFFDSFLGQKSSQNEDFWPQKSSFLEDFWAQKNLRRREFLIIGISILV